MIEHTYEIKEVTRTEYKGWLFKRMEESKHYELYRDGKLKGNHCDREIAEHYKERLKSEDEWAQKPLWQIEQNGLGKYRLLLKYDCDYRVVQYMDGYAMYYATGMYIDPNSIPEEFESVEAAKQWVADIGKKYIWQTVEYFDKA